MWRPVFLAGLLTAVFSADGRIAAAPPKVDFLFPAGLQRGTTTTLRISGTRGSAPVQCWCNRPDVRTTVDMKQKTLSVTVPPTALPGPCFVRFYNAEGASALKTFLIGTVPERAEKEPNNRLSEAQKLQQLPVTLNGVLSKPGEVDTFFVSLKAGQTLVASVQANEAIGSPMDAVLQIVSARGFVLAQNDDRHGLDPQLAFTAPHDGLFAIRIFAFPAVPNSSVRLAGGVNYVYRLTLTTGPFADHAVPLAVSAGTSLREKQTVHLEGWNLPPALRQLTPLPTNQPDTFAVHHPQLPRAILLPAVPHPSLIEAEPNSPPRPQTVRWPATITGHIDEPSDTDAFQFSAQKGQRLTARVDARKLGSPLDPVLELFDAAGKRLARAETRSSTAIDETLTAVIPADGVYRLTVSDLYGHGGRMYFYRLTLSAARPGFTLRTTSDRFVLVPNKPLSIPVTIQRERGCRDEISFSVQGLPPGVTVKTATSQPTGKTSRSVTLVFTAKKMSAKTKKAVPWNGPITIIGRGKTPAGKTPGKRGGKTPAGNKSSPPVMRQVAAPVEGRSTVTSFLWLTVRPAE